MKAICLRFVTLLWAGLFALTACKGKKDPDELSQPSARSQVVISLPLEFLDWDTSTVDDAAYYVSPDGQFLAFVVPRNLQPIEDAVEQLRTFGPAGLSLDNVQDATVGGKEAKRVELTQGGEGPIKFQINLIKTEDRMIHVGIALPLGQSVFLTDPDKWPAFLQGISFEDDQR